MPPRAPALPPDQRRAALVEATIPLLRRHGRAVSTKDIAAAAGVAEGTIFRAFGSKDDLVSACIEEALDPLPLIAKLEGIDREQPLRARALELTAHTQARFTEVFELLIALGLTGPPPASGDRRGPVVLHQRTVDLTEELLHDPDGELRVSPREFMRYLRLLTFAGSHPALTQQHPLTPEEIVDTLLFGLAAPSATTTPDPTLEP